MHQLDMYTQVLIEQQHAATMARLERRRLVREALAGRLAFYEPMLASVGSRMVTWGTRLQRRYHERQRRYARPLSFQND